MNERSFVRPPWVETEDGETYTVVVEAYHWCGHPSFGYTQHRTPFASLKLAAAYMERLGFALATA